ncbi:MAG TPA: response regulator [Candidatus Limnocylindria bacterium]|jgi:CheY-like chemotaxis protein
METLDVTNAPTSGSSPDGLAYPHVLVIEDEPNLRMIVRRNLEHRGVQVTEAADAAEALTALAEAPDLLLLDINLPDRTGWDVLRELRERGPIPPTVVVSAVRVPAERLREFGVVAYLPKPFPIDALTRLVVEGVRA